MKTLTTVPVPLGDRAYAIQIGRDWLEEAGVALAEALVGGRGVLVTDARLEALWGPRVRQGLSRGGIHVETCVIPAGEPAKTLSTVEGIYDWLLERRYGRQTALIALGGGVVGDVAGFAAATFLRGLGLAQMPTSLLAMVDSSIGGKTGVNHPRGKNLIGAFKQPAIVIVELAFLDTLPAEELSAGLAEVVKYGMIADESLFKFLEARAEAALARDPDTLTRLIARSCEIKAAVVAQDETETGLRAILNFGHTFAHAVETLQGYQGLRHGEAVAGGMVAACRLGEIVGGLSPEVTERLRSLLARLRLPASLPAFPPELYFEAMRADKKARDGRLRFVVPSGIGEVALREGVAESAARASLLAAMDPG